MKLLRISLTTLATAIAVAMPVPAAQAGTYDVPACDAAFGAVNNSWTFETNDSAHIQGSTACPSSTNYSGLLAQTKLLSGNSPVSSYGQWIVRAPAGTTITRFRLRRWLGMERGSGWTLYGRQADGTTLLGETCTDQVGTDECNVGGFNSSTIERFVNTTSIAYGFTCPSAGLPCTTGGTIHDARAAIYSSIVTINDPTSPAIGSPSGELVRASGYHKGTESVTFNGTDALGVRFRRVTIDNAIVATETLACDFTKLVPCTNPASPVTLSTDLNQLADGAHTVRVVVVDAAGNETSSSPTSIVVDHTAPVAPWFLEVDSRANTSPAFTASWENPSGQVAPITTAHWRLCPEGSASGCSTGSTSGTTLSGSLPAYGRYTLSVVLEDAAANVGAESSRTLVYDAPPTPTPTATPTVTPTVTPTATPTPPVRTPTPAPPAVTPTPVGPGATPVPTATPAPRASARLKVTAATLKRSSRSLSVTGTTAASATGKVRVKLTYRVGRKARSKTFTATIKRGRFTVRARLSATDARRASKLAAAVTYAGDRNYSGASTRRAVKVRR